MIAERGLAPDLDVLFESYTRTTNAFFGFEGVDDDQGFDARKKVIDI